MRYTVASFTTVGIHEIDTDSIIEAYHLFDEAKAFSNMVEICDNKYAEVFERWEA